MTRSPDVDVLVIGGGIAGLSAAWFARRAGRRVTIVDEGIHCASTVPVALINPLRGHAGRLIAGGVDGARAGLALIDGLRDAGHAIGGGSGLWRPLIGVEPAARQAAFWAGRVGARLAFDWHDVAPASLGLAEPVPALRLHDAGWVVSRDLLDALRVDSDATVVVDRVTRLQPAVGGGGLATLASGATIRARAWVWCGGAWGASRFDDAPDGHDGLYKPGSLLAIDGLAATEPMSFGLYAAPAAGGTLVGPSREGSRASFAGGGLTDDARAHLADRIAGLFGSTSPAREAWRGVRLARLSSAASSALADIPRLTQLGSRGYLSAPLLAAAWARSL